MQDSAVITAWQQNANAWAKAIKQQAIASRVLVTNQAILNSIEKLNAKTLLDVGCGEGWLTLALQKQGVNAYGCDATEALLQQSLCPEKTLYLCRYENMAQKIPQTFDALVCNFSLIGKNDLTHVLTAGKTLLNSNGHLVIQTLHPALQLHNTYNDGWVCDHWQGLGGDFKGENPWYFRRLSTWLNTFHQHGYHLQHCNEPIHPKTQLPASIIFTLKLAGL